jgi:uncharacterized cupin superfamily protein
MASANLYDSPGGELEAGHIKGLWRDLGRMSATRDVGVRRIEVAPGYFSTPAHEHGGDEEVFFVLGGSGVLWQNGETFTVGGGDCMVHKPRRGPHTLRADAGGLDVLVFGERRDPSLTALPRAGVAWSFPRWVTLDDGENPFEREAACGPPECPPPNPQRPDNVVALDDVPAIFDGRARRLGQTAGASATGLNHVTLGPDGTGAPAHCHSEEEEVFVVLDGGGVLELWGRGADAPDEHPLARGDVISRPPGTGVSHALRAGPDGLTYLAYGTRRSGDMCFYPQTGMVSLRGLGIALQAPEVLYLPDL